MKFVLSSAVSNTNVRAIASGLVASNLLHEFYTPVATFPGSTLDRLGAFSPFSDLRRRRFNPELMSLTRSWPWFEFGRQIALKTRLSNLVENEKSLFSADAVFRKHDLFVAAGLEKSLNKGVTSVYSYEDMALNTFKKAKSHGIDCVYDQPMAYWETGLKLLTEEGDRLPQWKNTLTGAGVNSSEAKLEHKVQELELADVIVVSSEFVKRSIPNWAKDKPIIMAPFGTPSGGIRSNNIIEVDYKKKNKPLRVLFAGSMGQRKGLGDLFTAIRLLNSPEIELVVMGSLEAPMSFYRDELPNFTYEPGRPHEQVLELMGTCDVFCMPSIVEGRALVMQEAMSQGLPLIITPNTGGEDLIIEGKTGFLVPIRSPEMIAEKLAWFIE